MKKHRSDFSHHVKRKLKRFDRGIPWLAAYTGISKNYLWDLIAGRRRWNEENMRKVADVLLIDIRYVDLEDDFVYQAIIGGEDKP